LKAAERQIAVSTKAMPLRYIAPVIEHAASFNLIIALENPGDGKDNLINTGKDGAELIKNPN